MLVPAMVKAERSPLAGTVERIDAQALPATPIPGLSAVRPVTVARADGVGLGLGPQSPAAATLVSASSPEAVLMSKETPPAAGKMAASTPPVFPHDTPHTRGRRKEMPLESARTSPARCTERSSLARISSAPRAF